MEEEILCGGCLALNAVEIDDEWHGKEEGEEFTTFKCFKCKKINSVSYSSTVTFSAELKKEGIGNVVSDEGA